MNGYVDTLAMVEVIHYLRAAGPEAMGPWTASCASDATKLVIEARHLKIASPPERGRAPSGLFGQLVKSLPGDASSMTPLPRYVVVSAADSADAWALAHIELLREVLSGLMRRELIEQYAAIPFSMWADHDRRFNGLFDEPFIRPISEVLRVPELELQLLHSRTRDEAQMAAMYRDFASSELGRTIAAAYVVSTLIRTWFHVFAAQVPTAPTSRRPNPRLTQVVFHPLRDAVLPRLPADLVCDPPGEVVSCLAEIALALARKQATVEQRIAVWGEVVTASRAGLRDRRIDPHDPATGDDAARIAAEGLDRCGVRVPWKVAEDAITIASSLGIGLLTSLALTPWAALIASTGAAVALQRSHIVDKASKDWRNVERLGNLAQGPGGRVRPVHQHG
jgi:hypothetical protein